MEAILVGIRFIKHRFELILCPDYKQIEFAIWVNRVRAKELKLAALEGVA